MSNPADDITAYHKLVHAIVRQTIYDYRKADERHTEAALFLGSREAREFCEAWNVDLEWVRKRLET